MQQLNYGGCFWIAIFKLLLERHPTPVNKTLYRSLHNYDLCPLRAHVTRAFLLSVLPLLYLKCFIFIVEHLADSPSIMGMFCIKLYYYFQENSVTITW